MFNTVLVLILYLYDNINVQQSIIAVMQLEHNLII